MATMLEKWKLLKGLALGDVAYTGPFFVKVDVTRRCNRRCMGCIYRSPLLDQQAPAQAALPKDLPFGLFARLCEDLMAMRTRALQFTGSGEPLLHPRIIDMVSMAKRFGLDVTLVTNGTRLDQTMIAALSNAGLDVLLVSMWAFSPQDYETMYPGSTAEAYDGVLENLRRFADHKANMGIARPLVELHHPISRYTFGNIHKIVELVSATGCDAVSYAPLKTSAGGLDALALTQDEERKVLDSMRRIEKRLDALSINHNTRTVIWRYGMGHGGWRKLPCYIAWLQARVSIDGTVYACRRCKLPMGSLHEQSLRDMWNGPAYRRFRREGIRTGGVVSLSDDRDCGFCGAITDNARIHRFFKWPGRFVSRFSARRGEART